MPLFALAVFASLYVVAQRQYVLMRPVFVARGVAAVLAVMLRCVVVATVVDLGPHVLADPVIAGAVVCFYAQFFCE